MERSMQSLGGPGAEYLELRSQREVQISQLRQELLNSQIETERMDASLRSQQTILQKNLEELAIYREACQRREETLRRLRFEEQQRLQSVMHDYKLRFEKERVTLKNALAQSDACCRIIEQVLPECQECEKVLLGETPNFREPLNTSPLRRSYPADTLGSPTALSPASPAPATLKYAVESSVGTRGGVLLA
mmetsp:Transcript_56364/g.115285  ORF Transcript_56364/g.115285 Transcript_56364/m.115285 type:complete len:191 (+) Transcript_56364:83-655(+)